MESLLLAQDQAIGAGFVIILVLFYLAIIVLFIAAGWKLMTKAGEPGWAILVPIYNVIVLLRIVGRPVWWILLFIIPFVNFIVSIIVYIDLAKSFGKDTVFALGLIFLSPIFFPILAFGDSRYLGPAGPEPRPGYPSIGQGGYGAPPYYGAPQGGYTPPPGQQWGQPPAGGQPGQQWGQQPGGQPPPQQPQQPQWGQPPGGQPPPQQPQWGQPPPSGGKTGQDYPPPPLG